MATQAFLHSPTGDKRSQVHRSSNSAKLNGSAPTGWDPYGIGTARGSGLSTSSDAATVAGPTSGIEVYSLAAATPLEWISPPLDRDVTISGTITCNVWAGENNMSANVSAQVVIERLDSQLAAVSTILNSARNVEMAVVPRAVNNWTATPTSTNMLKGDRLRIRLAGNDAVSDTTPMASGFLFNFSYAATSAAVDGDTYVTFTETFGFQTTAPAGSQLFLTDTASDVATANVDREMWTSRGGGVVTDVTNTATGWTTGIQVTDTAGGTAVEWYTKRLQAFTLADLVLVNVRALESNAAANASLSFELAVCDADGSGAVVWAKALPHRTLAAGSAHGELTTTEAAYTAHLAGDDTAVTDGKRLRFRVYVDDSNLAALVTGHTVTTHYGGTSGGASGDTYITLAQTVSEFAAGTAWDPGTQAEALAITDSATFVLALGAAVSDPLALADDETLAATFARSQADTFGVADVAAAGLAFGRSYGDLLDLTDSGAGAIAFKRGFELIEGDELPLTDQLVGAAALVRSQDDPLGLADVAALVAALQRAFADTAGVIDLADPLLTGGAVAHERTVDDPLGIVDAALRELAVLWTLADSAGVADAVSRQRDIAGTVVDPLALTDTPALLATLLRAFADTAGIADVAAPDASKQVAVADLLGVADLPALAAVLVRVQADPLALVDAQAFDRGHGVADTAGIADLAGGVILVIKPLADLLGITDTQARVTAFGVPLADPLGLADQAATVAVLARAFADPVGVADSTSALIVVLAALADTLGLVDNRALAAGTVRAFADPIGLVDLAAAGGSTTRLLADQVGVADLALRDLGRAFTLADQLGAADVAALARGTVWPLDDPLTLADQLARARDIASTLADLLTIVDLADTEWSGEIVVLPPLVVAVAGVGRPGVSAVGVGARLVVTGSLTAPTVTATADGGRLKVDAEPVAPPTVRV